uniref:Ymf57 n=1 Tax=Uronema marinum TaxID=35107 RepID=A0A345WJT9_UROMR|nr:ymf57 [Uronema marinum]AXJ93332.1 ymf57 [Uronema marinum]
MMLKFKIVTFNFFRFVQSGLYVDFFLKKLVELFVKNFFIYAAQFLGEKYMIEFLTKKVIDSSIFNTNKIINLGDLFYSQYFISLLSILFLSLSLFNVLILI